MAVSRDCWSAIKELENKGFNVILTDVNGRVEYPSEENVIVIRYCNDCKALDLLQDFSDEKRILCKAVCKAIQGIIYEKLDPANLECTEIEIPICCPMLQVPSKRLDEAERAKEEAQRKYQEELSKNAEKSDK